MIRTLLSLAVLAFFPSCLFVVERDHESAHVYTQHADEAQAAASTEPAEAPSGDEMAPMRTYWMGMIKRGPGYFDEVSDEDRASLQQAHLDRIGELAQEGKIILAGPFGPQEGEDDPLIGLFLYTVETREEAEALAASDPAVASGRLRVDLVQWYGVSGITYPGNPMPEAAAVAGESDA
jgi:uncharacterized protein YciI